MNVRNPRKRVPTAKGKQNKNLSDLPTEPLAVNNVIPKQHVGIDQANQLKFNQETDRIFSPIGRQTYFNEEDDFSIPFKTYIRIDEDPFEFLTEDLFDTPISEDDISIQPEINKESVNEPNEEVDWVTFSELFQSNESTPSPKEAPKKRARVSTRKKECKYSNDAVENHPLTPIINEWLKQLNLNKQRRSSKRSIINRFIKFLVDKKVDAPAKKDVLLYDKFVRTDKLFAYSNVYMSVVRAFFRWANSASLYEDIAKGTEKRISTYEKYVSQDVQPGQQLTTSQQVIMGRQKDTVTVTDMENAKFLYKHAEYLINNDLRIFKKWVETLDVDSVDSRRKLQVLKFAHFLHSENRTTPTQQDIIDYYKQNLSTLSISTVNKAVMPIRHFFEWTAEQTIYPNVAINIYTADRIPTNADDIPILPNIKGMKPVPSPTKPLINKTI